MPIPTEEQKLSRRLASRLLKAMRDFELISDGDKILIGLSGGKDSLCLVDLLAQRMRILKPRFTLQALHIRMRNIEYKSDLTYLKDFCESRGVPFYTATTGFDASTDSRKSPCFLCSWNRRKQLFTTAQALGCNKIALGHHQDDIIHTTMMNLFFQGSFSTMPVKLTMRKMPLTIIRPLCLASEADLRRYAELNGYQKQVKLCPNETSSHRADMAEMFKQIEQMSTEARYCVWNALQQNNKLVE